MITADVILLCYNQEQFIEKALRSIYAQEVSKDVSVRILVADDCSQDSTLDIIKRIASESPYPIEILPKEANLGISKNYRRSFAAATADYVLILEGDDWWEAKTHIMQHVLFLEGHKECSMSMNRFYGISTTKNEMNVSPWRCKDDFYTIDLQKQIAVGNQLGNLSACCFRSKHLHQLQEEMYAIHVDDYLLGIMMARMGNIAILKDPTSVYRSNPNSMWASLSLFGQYRRNLYFAKTYDEFLNGEYHDLWVKYKKNLRWELWIEIKKRIAHTITGKNK